MKKSVNKILVSFAIILFILAKTVLAVDLNYKELEYTEEYKNYLELSDEEKSKVLEPRKYKIISTENNSTNDNYLKNEKISLENLLTVLRATQYSKEKKFSLKDIISDNIVIKNQMQTNTCLSFSTMSGLETNLALKDYYNNANVQKAVNKYDFSERHMAYSMSQSFTEGKVNKYGYSIEVSNGASMPMAIAYLTNGQGAVNEADMPFKNSEEKISIREIQNKEIQTTVNDIEWFESIEPSEMVALTDNQKLEALKEKIKEHVSTNGSVSVGVYAPTTQEEEAKYLNDGGAIYVNEIVKGDGVGGQKVDLPSNHGVSIIGWDDDYAKTKFKTEPKNNGAWIVKNSWGEKDEYTFAELKQMLIEAGNSEQAEGEQFNAFLSTLEQGGYTVDRASEKVTMVMGDNGLYYFSYEDVYIYSQIFGIVSADNKKTYDNLYQVDELGGNAAYSLNAAVNNKLDIYLANTFHRETTQPEYLTSIGMTNLVSSATYEVYINPNGKDKSPSKLQKAELTVGNEVTLTAGYNTIKFKNPYKLKGTDYVIVLKQKFGQGEGKYFTMESIEADANVSSKAGESFITVAGFTSDADWLDIGAAGNESGLQGNLCIKGLTVNSYEGDVSNDPNATPDNPNDGDGSTLNSDFSEAKAEITGLDIDSTSTNFEFNFVVKNIKVKELCDSYVHYVYLSSSKTKTKDEIDAQGRWVKLGSDSFVKQADGTYNLNITLNKVEQLIGLRDDESSDELYIYIKEEATKDGQTETKVYSPIEFEINTGNVVNGGNGVNTNKKEDGDNKANEDPTKATTPLPNTGFKKIIIAGIVIFMISSVCYIKIRKMRDIR